MDGARAAARTLDVQTSLMWGMGYGHGYLALGSLTRGRAAPDKPYTGVTLRTVAYMYYYQKSRRYKRVC